MGENGSKCEAWDIAIFYQKELALPKMPELLSPTLKLILKMLISYFYHFALTPQVVTTAGGAFILLLQQYLYLIIDTWLLKMVHALLN